eukprot:TRINITY_DN11336_c0_g1_i1.p1 TRINITY_DN11336_c0_g1~~TRINITY_DN11336_c0_g1_i1.p1  ORF type:complete len:228 (+),score=12.18 TRINITY_DN11336_c0_g1_i1:36-719(+)
MALRTVIRIIKSIAFIVALVTFVLILASFFVPWYQYQYTDSSLGSVQAWETFTGRQVNVTLLGITASSSLTWPDANSPSVKDLFMACLATTILALFINFFLVIILSLAAFCRLCSMRMRVGARFIKRRLKQAAIAMIVLEIILVAFSVFWFSARHAPSLSSDWPEMTHGLNCTFDFCDHFYGEHFGPDLGWLFMFAVFILSIIDGILITIYACVVTGKKFKYQKLGK